MPAGGDELCTGHRVAAREQGDLVALPDELLREVRHDPLRPAIVFRRHALVQRRDLGHLHRVLTAKCRLIPRPSMFAPSVARPQVGGHHANAADHRMSDNTPAPSLIPCPAWQVFSDAYGWRVPLSISPPRLPRPAACIASRWRCRSPGGWHVA